MKDSIPFFSIVLPTFNRAKELKKAIDSILSQTYNNFELIIIDNHSIDETDNVLKNIIDSRIRIIKIHNEGIIAKSRNLGISISKGLYIAFLDSDDLWYNNKLEVCYCTIKKNNPDFLYHEMIINTNHFKLVKKNIGSISYNKPVYLDLLNKGNMIANSSVVVKKNILNLVEGFNENIELITSEDFECWLNIANLTNKFFFINEILGVYLNNDNSESKKVDKTISSNNFIFKHHLIPSIANKSINKIPEWYYYNMTRAYYINGNNIEAIRFAKLSMVNSRFWIKIKLFYMLFFLKLKNC
jgi:glycosyltransferase involved in cell wall biosynthesis